MKPSTKFLAFCILPAAGAGLCADHWYGTTTQSSGAPEFSGRQMRIAQSGDLVYSDDFEPAAERVALAALIAAAIRCRNAQVQAACSALNITPPTLAIGVAQQAYVQTLSGNGGTQPYTFALARNSELPAGLGLSNVGLLAGIPARAGNSTFSVVVSDSNCCGVSQTFALTIVAAEFSDPQPVRIIGYGGDAMEPFVTRDGRFLLFNNSNAVGVDTNLRYAEYQDGLTFVYRGEIAGANATGFLDAVASIDVHGNLYFVSTRSYAQTLSTIYAGAFDDGVMTGVHLVPGVSLQRPGMVNFDAAISDDGNTLIFVDGHFSGGEVPDAADLVMARRQGSGFERDADSANIFTNINTPALEYAPCLAVDERELFFTRLDPAAPQPMPVIYHATRSDAAQAFGVPVPVAALHGFVEAPALSPDQHSLYYHALIDGRFVIYRVTR